MSKRSPTAEEMLDEANRKYEDNLFDGPDHEGPVDPSVLDSPTPGTSQEDMETEEDRNLAAPDDGLMNLLGGSSFGPRFKAVLEQMLLALEPHAAMGDPNAKPKQFSNLAKIKMTGETKRSVAGLYDELHEAIFHDRKITFKKPTDTTNTIQVESDWPCTCGILVQAIQKCPHFNSRHGEVLKQAVDAEDKRQYAKVMRDFCMQTDRQLSPTRSVASSAPSEDRPLPRDAKFVRGKGRGGYDRNRGRSERSENYKKHRDNSRDRSRSSLRKDDRDRSRDSSWRGKESGRGRGGYQSFKRPSQPAQDRLMQERKRMEEPSTRQEAEAVAARARKEAETLALKAKKEADKLLSIVSGPSVRKKPGDSALGADGQIDYNTCPEVKAPPGMKTVITVKNGLWHVSLEQKD
jgi:hypothetical protein